MSEFESINPHSGEHWKSYDRFDLRHLDSALQKGDEAQRAWARTSWDERSTLLRNMAQGLRDSVEELASLATREMGKPLAASRAEVEKCAWVCDYYAEHGPGHLRDREMASDNRESYLSYRPLGLILAIMPWNFPYWQAYRFLAPTLMAGNAAVLKHASNVPGCALAIESQVRGAGFPPDLFQTLLVGSKDAASLISHDLVRGVSFTGSEAGGREVAAQAGRAIRKTVLELGGSDPYLVLEDADLGPTVESCVTSRLLNNGQSCIAAKRFIVQDSIHDDFVAAMVAAMRDRRGGDPMDESTDIGPLARPDLCENLASQVSRSLEAGARCALGGGYEGNHFQATVLTDVRPGMPAFDEELFGPVAAVIRARDETEAIRLANSSPYGLGAAVFTGDLARGERIAREGLEAGCCFVNDFVKSDPRLPFGGIKSSGYGRELGELGIREFTNIKTVVVS